MTERHTARTGFPRTRRPGDDAAMLRRIYRGLGLDTPADDPTTPGDRLRDAIDPDLYEHYIGLRAAGQSPHAARALARTVLEAEARGWSIDWREAAPNARGVAYGRAVLLMQDGRAIATRDVTWREDEGYSEARSLLVFAELAESAIGNDLGGWTWAEQSADDQGGMESHIADWLATRLDDIDTDLVRGPDGRSYLIGVKVWLTPSTAPEARSGVLTVAEADRGEPEPGVLTPLQQAVAWTLGDLAAFDATCTAREYTDTGVVWELIAELRERLSAALAADAGAARALAVRMASDPGISAYQTAEGAGVDPDDDDDDEEDARCGSCSGELDGRDICTECGHLQTDDDLDHAARGRDDEDDDDERDAMRPSDAMGDPACEECGSYAGDGHVAGCVSGARYEREMGGLLSACPDCRAPAHEPCDPAAHTHGPECSCDRCQPAVDVCPACGRASMDDGARAGCTVCAEAVDAQVERAERAAGWDARP